MLYINLINHDLKYEVSELIKLFTNNFEFCTEKNFARVLENRLLTHNDTIISTSRYYTNYEMVFEEKQSINVKDLDEEKIKKLTKEMIKRSIYKVLQKVYNTYVPWGILTGIRPVKIVHSLLDEGYNYDYIKKYLSENYYISDEKIELAIEIAKRERTFIYPIDENKISLYVSIPFCPTRCYYCSFPANPLKTYGHLREEYSNKLIEEIKGISEIIKENNKEIETLYIGGGTPTALEAKELDLVITSLFKELNLENIKEFTVEAGRPDTITKEKLQVLKKHNVSRISINPQSMNDITLEKIGRGHKVQDIIDCFNMARDLGFDNINMDIILGLVDEDVFMVENTLKQIQKLNPESLTVHTLAVKRSSTLKENIENYELTQYEEMIKMIDLSMEYAKKMGLNPYYMYRQKHMLGNLENIGYAKEGYECIYNMQIMEEKQSNYAIGAGAISKFVYVDEDRIERVENVKNVEQYIERTDEMLVRKRKEIKKNVN